jgi:hypothetical protein
VSYLKTNLPQIDHPDKVVGSRLLQPFSPQNRFVVEIGRQLLQDYDPENGLVLTDCLTTAKLFSREAQAREAASLFNGRVHRVLTDMHGSYPRIALLHNRSDW